MNDAPTRTKRWRPKTRTGCRTCRLRRVKCDETRPLCRKCSSNHRQCGGYEIPAPTTLQKPTLLPKPEMLPPKLNDRPGNSALLPFKLDAAEARAFDCFRCKILHFLSIQSSSNLWEDVVFKAGYRDATILNAIIATGALFQVRHLSAQYPDASSWAAFAKRENEQIALKRYTASIESLRLMIGNTTLANRSHTTQTTLVACLLFICFELLQNQQMQAMLHMMKGLMVLNASNEAQSGLEDRAKTSIDTRTGSFDEISAAFARLDIDSAIFGKWQPYIRSKRNSAILPSCPPCSFSFKTLREAKEHLKALTSATLTYRSKLLDCVYQASPEALTSQSDWLRYSCILGAKARRIPYTECAEFLAERNLLLKAFEAWLSALLNLEPARLEVPFVTLLEVQALFPWILLTHSQHHTEKMFDQYKDKFEHILALATKYAQGANGKAWPYGFAMDAGMLASLYIIGIKCRDPGIRRKTILILKEAKIQEGLWNGWASAICVERVMELEQRRARSLDVSLDQEGDLSAESIAEEARFVNVVHAINSGKGRLLCARYLGETSDDLELEEFRYNVFE